MFVALLFCLSFIGFVSCGSVSIPWESETIEANLTVEYYLIAEEYFALEEYSKAIEYYEKVRFNDDLALQANYKIARSYVFLEDWYQAEKALKALLRNDSENTHLQMSYAYVLAASGESKKAIKIYEDLIEKEYYDPSVIKNLVLLYVFIEDYESAQTNFDIFKERFPEHEYTTDLESALEIPTEDDLEEDFEETELEAILPDSSAEQHDDVVTDDLPVEEDELTISDTVNNDGEPSASSSN